MKLFDSNNRDTDFMAELEAATRLRPATPVILMLLSVMALAVLAIIWAGFSTVEIITHGDGQVVPSQEIQVVQSLDGGILEELLVHNGEQVKKGQVLLRINNTQASSDEKSAESKYLSLMAKKARLTAEANGQELSMPDDVTQKSPQIAANEKQLYDSRQKELKNAFAITEDRINKSTAELAEVRAQINRFSENKKLLQQQLAITVKMVEQKAAPMLDEIKLQREMADLDGQISAGAEKQKGLQAELEEAKKQKESQEGSFRSQALTDLNDTETQLGGLQENLKSMGARVDRTEIRSPLDGIVNNIAITTIGGVIEPAMRLIEIVPLDSELKIVAKVSPEEVAFLKAGQDVKVKITAYDSQKYGVLHGTLERVGANSVTDREGHVYFEIEVRADKNYMGPKDNPLPITSGMVAKTEVITGKRTILEYLLKPILRARDIALTER